jgi:hypothetical protein
MPDHPFQALDKSKNNRFEFGERKKFPKPGFRRPQGRAGSLTSTYRVVNTTLRAESENNSAGANRRLESFSYHKFPAQAGSD